MSRGYRVVGLPRRAAWWGVLGGAWADQVGWVVVVGAGGATHGDELAAVAGGAGGVVLGGVHLDVARVVAGEAFDGSGEPVQGAARVEVALQPSGDGQDLVDFAEFAAW